MGAVISKYVFLIGLAALMYSPANASALSEAAEKLNAGEWVELETEGFTGSLLSTGDVDYVINYGNSAVWDPVAREIRYMGKGHQESEKMIIYSESNNSWSTGPTTSSAPHGYDHNAIDPSTGEHYYYGGGTTMRVYRNGDWESFPGLPGDRYDYSVALGLEYFPERQCLLLAAEHDIYSYENGEWNSIQSRISTGSYHMIAEYNPVYKEVYLGGGNGETQLYRVNAEGEVDQIPPSPIQIGVNRAVAVVDPSSGEFLILGRDKSFRAYSPLEQKWSSLNPDKVPIWSDSHPDRPTKFLVAAPISEYGVIMFLSVDHGVFLYKHDSTEELSTLNPSFRSASQTLQYENGQIVFDFSNGEKLLFITDASGRIISIPKSGQTSLKIPAPFGKYYGICLNQSEIRACY